MAAHVLKTWPAFFAALWAREKTFEVRRNDRDFQVGDRLYLNEYDPTSDRYLGRQLVVEVTYIMFGGRHGVDDLHCVMAVREIVRYAELEAPHAHP